MQARKDLAPPAGFLRAAKNRAPKTTPAWEARKDLNESSYNWINFSPVFSLHAGHTKDRTCVTDL